MKVVIVSTKEAKPRGLYVAETNVVEHGFTSGCGDARAFNENMEGNLTARNAENDLWRF